MPFKSDAQRRWMFWAADEGMIPKSMPKRWAKETKNIKSLPEKVKKKKLKKKAFEVGFRDSI